MNRQSVQEENVLYSFTFNYTINLDSIVMYVTNV